MKTLPLVKMQKFDDAFVVIKEMEALYDPILHTATISDAYGTDWCASMILCSALWHLHLHQSEKALDICEDVIQSILPEVAKANANNRNMMGINYVLYQMIQVLRSQGQHGANRAYELYKSCVLEPLNTGSKPLSFATSFIP